MTKKIISAGNVPFSKAIICDSKQFMEVSGQVGLDPITGKLTLGIEKQTKQSLDNIRKILEDEGWTLTDITKVRVYLVDMSDYAKVNEIYKNYFQENFPTRVALAVKALPLGALIEIECTAARD